MIVLVSKSYINMFRLPLIQRRRNFSYTKSFQVFS